MDKKPMAVLAALGAVMLSACVPQTGMTVVTSCPAGAFQHLVGQPEKLLPKAALPANTRILRPGGMATLDYNEKRMNVRVGDDRKVAEVTCG